MNKRYSFTNDKLRAKNINSQKPSPQVFVQCGDRACGLRWSAGVVLHDGWYVVIGDVLLKDIQ